MRKITLTVFSIFSFGYHSFTQSTVYTDAKTAQDPSVIHEYTGAYAYGTNMGYFGSHLNDISVAQLIYNAGARSSRISLPDWLITDYGVNARVNEFQFYEQLGMKDLTAFVGEPSQKNRETITFSGCPQPAKTFKGLYEPIWLDVAKTLPNPANTYAYYLHQTVKTYGKYVKFWEVVNEPDYTWGDAGWNDAQPHSWYKQNPNPADLPNMYAPIQYYVRMLRVSWEIIKTLEPTDYVCTGGIGYTSFLDALLRNTDNPVDGSVTANYPNKGGAYFDVLSYHDYPQYGLSYWDNGSGQVKFTRHSDAAAEFHIGMKNRMDSILKKHSYGTTHPTKQWICTETDLGNQNFPNDGWGSPEAAKNFVIKQNVLSQLHNIKQVYKWGINRKTSPSNSFESMGLFFDLQISTTTVSNAKPSSEYYQYKTASQLLYGNPVDKNKTAQLNLPTSVRGAAFKKKDGRYIYVLWAKTTQDLSENASAVYNFPFVFYGIRRKDDFSQTAVSDTLKTSSVDLNGSVIFLEELEEKSIVPPPPPSPTPPSPTPPAPTPPAPTPPAPTPPAPTPPAPTPPAPTPPAPPVNDGKTRPTISPNPTRNALTIKSSSPVKFIYVIDMLGRTVASFPQTSASPYLINIGWLKNGMYLLAFDNIIVEKVIKL